MESFVKFLASNASVITDHDLKDAKFFDTWCQQSTSECMRIDSCVRRDDSLTFQLSNVPVRR